MALFNISKVSNTARISEEEEKESVWKLKKSHGMKMSCLSANCLYDYLEKRSQKSVSLSALYRAISEEQIEEKSTMQ